MHKAKKSTMPDSEFLSSCLLNTQQGRTAVCRYHAVQRLTAFYLQCLQIHPHKAWWSSNFLRCGFFWWPGNLHSALHNNSGTHSVFCSLVWMGMMNFVNLVASVNLGHCVLELLKSTTQSHWRQQEIRDGNINQKVVFKTPQEIVYKLYVAYTTSEATVCILCLHEEKNLVGLIGCKYFFCSIFKHLQIESQIFPF